MDLSSLLFIFAVIAILLSLLRDLIKDKKAGEADQPEKRGFRTTIIIAIIGCVVNISSEIAKRVGELKNHAAAEAQTHLPCGGMVASDGCCVSGDFGSVGGTQANDGCRSLYFFLHIIE